MDQLSSRESRDIRELAKILAKISDEKEALKVLRDLCTLDEIREIARRWKAVRLINQKVPYREVSRITGLSTATVTRVAYWLHNGKGGYRLLLERSREL